jgi:ATP-dependent Lhr-like helicase
MDVDAAARIVDAIREGAIEVVATHVSVLGAAGLFSSRDLIPPESADTAILATVKRRIEDSDVVLCCMNCHRWKMKAKVSRVDERPQCPVCTARLIAALKPWVTEISGCPRRKAATRSSRANFKSAAAATVTCREGAGVAFRKPRAPIRVASNSVAAARTSDESAVRVRIRPGFRSFAQSQTTWRYTR